MVGITITIIVAAWVVFVRGSTMEAGFLSAMDFLWLWYVIITVVKGVLIALTALIATGAITFVAAEATGSKISGLLGLVSGGAVSVLGSVFVMISQVLLLGGTYLLMTAGTSKMVFADFSTSKLIFGTLLLAVGLVMSKNTNASND